MAAEVARKRVIRFSIASLLFIMLCLGGYLGGYRVGFDVGKNGGSQARLVVKSYSVGDLVTSRTPLRTVDFDSLIELIIVTVSPADWMENGTGEGEIQPFLSNLSLVVSQTDENHKAITALLRQLRQAQPPLASTSTERSKP